MGDMSVVVIGAGGQLGHELVTRLGADAIALARVDLDLCDFVYTRRLLSERRPDAVINAAAFTRVDDCEAEPSRAFWVNALAVRHLAQLCADLGCLLVHVSTDYVFDGGQHRPYTEDDVPNPVSVYGVSKLAGEQFVRALAPRHLIVRTCGLYGEAGAVTRRGNFVETMLRLADEGRAIRVVADQVLTPSSARDVARKISELVALARYGTFHVTNAGQCSWFEFAQTIFDLAGLRPLLEPTTSAAYGARARRPAYSVLAHERLAALGADDLPSWRDALTAYLRDRGRLAAAATRA
jgi:dTDP-4-dehydrorhamnose reductase